MLKVNINVASEPGLGSEDPFIEVRNNIAYLAGTQVAVWVLVGYRRMGISLSDLHRTLPGFSRMQLQAAMHYYRSHKTEIDYLLSQHSLPPLRIPLQ